MRAVLAAALLALPLAGCLEDAAIDPVVKVAGTPDGTSPTSVFLKAHVRAPDGRVTLVDFDRTEWYVAGLEREFHRVDYLSVEGRQRVTNEVLADDVVAPADLEARFRYDAMGANETRQAEMDAEWDVRLDELGIEPDPPLDWLGRGVPEPGVVP